MIVATFTDGSTIVRDDHDDFACNQRYTLRTPDGKIVRRGPEWRMHVVALHRKLTPATTNPNGA